MPVFINGVEQVAAHKTKHQDGGTDEVSIAALSGEAADDQPVIDAQVTAVAVARTILDANSILGAVSDNTPVAIALAASRILGRKASGDIAAMTVAELLTLIGVETGATADLTGAEIVTLLEALGGGSQLSHDQLDDVSAVDHHSNTNDHANTLDHAEAHNLADHATRTHANLSDAPASAHHTKYTNAEAVTQALAQKLDDFATPDDNTDLNFGTTRHGLTPKGTNVGDFLRDDGTFATPAGGNLLIANLQDFVEAGVSRSLFMVGAAPQSAVLNNTELIGIGVTIREIGTGSVTLAQGADMLGGFRCNTFATSGGNAGFNGPGFYQLLNDPTLCCRVRQDGSQSSQILAMGLSTSVGFEDGNNRVFFRLVDTGNWFGVADNAGTETVRDTTNNDTVPHALVIIVTGTGTSIAFRFDGVQVGAAVTTNIPSVSLNLGAVSGIRNSTGASRVMDVTDFLGWAEA